MGQLYAKPERDCNVTVTVERLLLDANPDFSQSWRLGVGPQGAVLVGVDEAVGMLKSEGVGQAVGVKDGGGMVGEGLRAGGLRCNG